MFFVDIFHCRKKLPDFSPGPTLGMRKREKCRHLPRRVSSMGYCKKILLDRDLSSLLEIDRYMQQESNFISRLTSFNNNTFNNNITVISQAKNTTC